MRGSDVRARRHDGDIGGDRQNEARRGRAGSGRPDEDNDGRARLDQSRDDVTGRVEQASGRAQDDDDDVGAGRVRLRDRLIEVLGGNGMDDAVEFGDDGEGLLGWGARRLSELRRRPQAQTDKHGDSNPRHAHILSTVSARIPLQSLFPNEG